ncbi:bacteriophage lambda head decoration protein D [Pseudomonas helmanticensis]|uniref:Bacteriophage lambda head decoration protein D n=1 Tax=Pseudomonas helmanticensis TaxID=1471381 RepID=A0A4R7V228_9PSED|nr:head decoration protein [Pseudomonas helmanticensis]TDV42900.1 bacteriophage lambda head decoration protein D [Pseudomonas helmanticensis]
MATFNQPKDLGDLLLVHVSPGWTKDRITLLGGSDYALGQVLANVAGKYQALDPAGAGPANKSVAVLAEHIDASAGDTPAVVIARGAVLALPELVWPPGITEPQKAAALDDLNAQGIVARATL